MLMKQEKMKSKFWLVGGVVALTFLGSGSIASAQSVTSYNDLAWGTGQLEGNITKITSPNGGSGLPSAGQLKNFSTGADTAVTLTITGGSFVGDAQAVTGANPTSGSDAFDIFDGKVSGLGALSYINSAGSDLVLTFTNMNPNKLYDLTFFGDRAANGWARASLVKLSGTGGRTNVSSVATDNNGAALFSGPTDNDTRLPAENPSGYVARWNQVNPGSDGQVVITVSYDGSDPFKGKYASAIRLVEGGVSGTDSTRNNDLDGDGKADLVWRNTSTGDVVGWLMNGLSLSSVGGLGTVGTDWKIVNVGDLDGDGQADLVWRNTSTGDVVGWRMNGLSLSSVGGLGTVGTDWKIQPEEDN